MSNEHAYAHPQQPTVPAPSTNGAVDRDTAKMTEHDKIERRKQLSREAEAIREMLRVKERELAELEAEAGAELGKEGHGNVDVDGEG